MPRPLTERDLEVLADLVYSRYESSNRRFYEGGTAPLDFGGSNGSHHGKTATKLVKHGFVEHRMRGHNWGDVSTRNAWLVFTGRADALIWPEGQ